MNKFIVSALMMCALFVFTGCESDKHVYNPNARYGAEPQMTTPDGGGPIVDTTIDDPWKKTGVGAVDAIPGDERGTPVDHPFKSSPIYFAYDSAVVGVAYDNLLKSLADYMNANPTYHLTIEGHCDERGSDEYNRALSERRALAVKEALNSFGAPTARINTVGYGEERPADAGKSLAAYAKNRRGEFAIFAK